jgi:hypothetical protein
MSIVLVTDCQRKESKPIFGNPAKLDLLLPNSCGFAASAHAKCAIYRLGSKRRELLGHQVLFGRFKGEHSRVVSTLAPNAISRLHDDLNIVNRYFALFNYSLCWRYKAKDKFAGIRRSCFWNRRTVFPGIGLRLMVSRRTANNLGIIRSQLRFFQPSSSRSERALRP